LSGKSSRRRGVGKLKKIKEEEREHRNGGRDMCGLEDW